MLGWAIAFFVAAIAAAVFGFGGIATAFMGIAQLLFYVFLALFAIALIASFFIRPAVHATSDGVHTSHSGGFGAVGALVAAAIIGIGIYAWYDNDMSAERVGRMIDRSASNITADASEAIEEAGDRAETVTENAKDGVVHDTANFLDEAGDNVRETAK